MFPFDHSPAISIRALMSFTANPFQAIPFPWGWSCFIQPGIGPISANHPRRLPRADSLPPPFRLRCFLQRLRNELKGLNFACTKTKTVQNGTDNYFKIG